MSKRREEVDMEMVVGRTASGTIVNIASITTRRSRRYFTLRRMDVACTHGGQSNRSVYLIRKGRTHHGEDDL
jgi:hypothetical protein